MTSAKVYTLIRPIFVKVTSNNKVARFFETVYHDTDPRPATDDRPLTRKLSNNNISATGHRIHFMFWFCRVGFSGSADRKVLFPVGPNSIGYRRKQCPRRNVIAQNLKCLHLASYLAPYEFRRQ